MTEQGLHGLYIIPISESQHTPLLDFRCTEVQTRGTVLIRALFPGITMPPVTRLFFAAYSAYLVLVSTARSLCKSAIAGNCLIYRYFTRSDKVTGQPQLCDRIIRQSENLRRQDPGFRNGT